MSADASAGGRRRRSAGRASSRRIAAQQGTAESAVPDESNPGIRGCLAAATDRRQCDRRLPGPRVRRRMSTTGDTSGTTPRPRPRPPPRFHSQSSTSSPRSTVSARHCCRRPVSTRRPCGSARRIPTASVLHSTTAPARPPAARCRWVTRSLAPPIPLGVDDWSLVWGSRLSQSTVDQLASIVVAGLVPPESTAAV